MVIWSKSFDHDRGQNFLNNLGQMVKILTMTMAQLQIFKMVHLNPYHKLDLKMAYLAIKHGANSKVSMVMLYFCLSHTICMS